MRRLVLLGLVALGVIAAAPASAAAPAAPRAAAGLSVDVRWAMLDDPTRVILIGQYACGPFPSGVPDRGVIDLEVRQTVSGVETVARGFLTPTVCDGIRQWYASPVTVDVGPGLSRRVATWSASGYVEGGGTMQNVFVPPTRIQIR
jgi:hypothetical protein